MTSTQQTYSGEGWNDCMPTVFAGAEPTKVRKSYKARVASIGSISAPPSRTASSTSIRPPPTISQTPSTVDLVDSGSNLPPTADSANSNNVDPTQVSELLCSVLEMPTSLVGRESAHYKTRLLAEVPNLESVHLSVVNKALELTSSGDSTGARNLLVQHSLVHNGISSWVVPLRRVVECVS